MKGGHLGLVLVVALLAGCAQAPAFVPACDAYAPRYGDFYDGHANPSATANLAVERGWTNITIDGWHVKAECLRSEGSQ